MVDRPQLVDAYGALIKAAPPPPTRGVDSFISSVPADRGNWWFPVVREPYTGAWQRDIAAAPDSLMIFYAVYACMERIASDVGKCRLRLVEQDSQAIWKEVQVAAFSPVIRKPNQYQNRIQFYENWVLSKLMAGNTYVLKERDNRNVVIAMHILDPRRVRVWQTPAGDVYYELGTDVVSGIDIEKLVPQSEIIHDMMTVKYHPLCGVPPLASAAMAANHGKSIQSSSTTFFQNRSVPSGILTAPGEIKEDIVKRLKEQWTNEFSGDNSGRIAVLGSGLKFEPMSMTADDAQLIEQLGITAQMVCSAFGVPPHMIGVGNPPSYNNIEALNQQYYSQTLQKYFEAIELGLDEGLGLVDNAEHYYGTWFDLDDLLRMDTQSMYEAEAKAVGGGFKSPNEARARMNLGPVPGGNSPYLQQQNFSLAALAKRDAKEDPFGKPETAAPKPPPSDAPPPPNGKPPNDQQQTDDDEEAADSEKALVFLAVAQQATWELQKALRIPCSTVT